MNSQWLLCEFNIISETLTRNWGLVAMSRWQHLSNYILRRRTMKQLNQRYLTSSSDVHQENDKSCGSTTKLNTQPKAIRWIQDTLTLSVKNMGLRKGKPYTILYMI